MSAVQRVRDALARRREARRSDRARTGWVATAASAATTAALDSPVGHATTRAATGLLLVLAALAGAALTLLALGVARTT